MTMDDPKRPEDEEGQEVTDEAKAAAAEPPSTVTGADDLPPEVKNGDADPDGDEDEDEEVRPTP